MQCELIVVIIVTTDGSKWRPALMAQLYRVAALSSATKATRPVGAKYRYIVRGGRLSGPFPSARCSVYCFREAPFAALVRALSLAEREWIGKQQKKKKKKQMTEWIFQRTVTPDYAVQTVIVVTSCCCYCTR